MTLPAEYQRFSRTQRLLGQAALERLAASKIVVVGLGGVGSYVVEALARSGVGRFVLVDHDTVDITNLNRQVHALTSTVGRPKVEVERERVLDINPAAVVETHQVFFTREVADEILGAGCSYVVDAIDSVESKVMLIAEAVRRDTPVISSMGAGNKLDPTKFVVADISKTHTDPLARAVRQRLRRLGITSGIKVVFSTEPPLRAMADAPARPGDAGEIAATGELVETGEPAGVGKMASVIELGEALEGARATRRLDEGCEAAPNPGALRDRYANRVFFPGSVAWVPPVAGLIIAGEVVLDLAVMRGDAFDDRQPL